ncbi:hypothetical protein [Mycoplasmopsis gallinarum]|uniref:hypothetical protein n=1 Tax=Mycoplasmopsis gallinarum TaxID=29557 RepID=UPI000A517989|nr:hypothetical protein [Mycoplasmopsis gallinarum]
MKNNNTKTLKIEINQELFNDLITISKEYNLSPSQYVRKLLTIVLEKKKWKAC